MAPIRADRDGAERNKNHGNQKKSKEQRKRGELIPLSPPLQLTWQG
jgi:hypothetical protein